MKVMTIDPGKVASYAVIDKATLHKAIVGEIEQIGKGRLLRPCPIHLANLIDEHEIDIVLVEEVGAMKGQGVTSMFSFGLVTGTVMGTASAKGIPLETVTPPKWKASIGIKTDDKADAKREARNLAKQLWPNLYEDLKPVGSHGQAEAALMGRWFFLKGPGAGALDDDAKKQLEIDLD